MILEGRRYTRASIIRDHVAAVLQHSLRHGDAILMRGRTTIDRLSGRLAAIHLPERADAIADGKKALMARLFGFPGGRAAKVFIGIAIAVGGMGNPVLAGIGVALAFLDP